MIRNKVKQLISDRGITVYQFRNLTGVANKTAYDLVNKPDQCPSKEVLDKICTAFEIQPNDVLEWVSDRPPSQP